MTRTTIATAVAERTTQLITARIRDENGQGFKPETLTLTLYDEATQAILNTRDHVSVLDVDGGTVDATGLLAMQLDPADMPFVGTAAKETHVALFEWTWSGGTKAGKYEVAIIVANLTKVP